MTSALPCLRVSTSEQTVENQRRELYAVAERHGWNVVAEFADEGISGAKGRDNRPAFDRLCRGVNRREFDQVAAWSADTPRRAQQDLMGFRADLPAKSVDLYLVSQGLDTAPRQGSDIPDDDVFAESRRDHRERVKRA